jgi:hypothetical protein
MDKEEIKQKQLQILELIKGFCDSKLNQEYYELSEKLVNKLGRKRNVPFATGKIEIWAAGVIHALGTINFLFDKSNEPYCSIDDINDFFGTKKSSSGNKSKEIRDMLKMSRLDNEFSTQSMAESNPFNSLVMVDGFITHISMLPEDLQETVKQIRAQGGDISFSTKK